MVVTSSIAIFDPQKIWVELEATNRLRATRACIKHCIENRGRLCDYWGGQVCRAERLEAAERIGEGALAEVCVKRNNYSA